MKADIEHNKCLLYMVPYFRGRPVGMKIKDTFIKIGLYDSKCKERFKNAIGILLHKDNGKYPKDKDILEVYPYGELLYGRQYMLVLKYEQAKKDLFTIGKYSKMYTKQELKKFQLSGDYLVENKTKILGVLTKSSTYRELLEQQLTVDDPVYIPEELDLDSSPILEKEIF